MKAYKKILLITFIVAVFFVVAAAGLAFYFLCTASGGRFLISRFLSRYPSSFDVDISKIDGSLAGQLVLRDIELRNIKGWPEEAVVRIQKADVYFASLDPKSLNIEAHNARFLFPSLGTIVIDGIYQDSRVDVDVFSSCIEAGQIPGLFPAASFLKNSSGAVRDINISIKGPLESLEFKGSFVIDLFSKEALLFKEIAVVFDLMAKDLGNTPAIFGEITVEKGGIALPKASFELSPSKITFKGDPVNPFLELRGTSRIEGADVKAVLLGELSKPGLKLTSDPPMPEEKLIMMLLTGIGDVSFKYDEQAKVFSLKKGITGALGVSYGVQQAQPQADGQQSKQKLGMSCKLTDTISIEGEKELQAQEARGNQTKVRLPDDAVFLKYRKKF
ncbi:MAG TPA: hypothetical protein DCL35_06815 [Candidatus Omnitrophica bacterium]|nr:hypothetical protein [Candidatus Omnitrophota bacterium]